MKKFFVKVIHSLFRIRFFENLLKPVVHKSYVGSLLSKLVPPNHTYHNPTPRKVSQPPLILNGNLFDYNDWKAYWGLREPERENLYKLARTCTTIIDVGANNGWVLMNLACIVSKNAGFVYGYEPHPDTYQRCVKNIESSGLTNCKVFNLGCSYDDGELIMTTVKESNSGQNRVVDVSQATSSEKTTRIHVTSLDKALGQLKKIDLIKVDVEGFEMNVLKGAQDILAKHKPAIFMEVDDGLLRKNNSSANDIINYIRRFNYTIKNASDNVLINEDDMLQNCHIDIICE